MAALWPGTPLTPPPRTAPAPHSKTLAWRVSTPQRPVPSCVWGQARSRWKMLPPGRPRSRSRSRGGPGLDARAAVGVGGQTVGEGLGEVGVELGEGGLEEVLAYGVVVGLEQPRGRVQAEQGERLVALIDQVRAEDGRIGEGVAVDLGGRGLGEHTGGGLGVGEGQLVVSLGDVEGPGERLARVDVLVAEPRKPREQHVHLELGALGRGGRCVAGQRGQFLGRGVHQDVPRGDGALDVGRPVGDLGGPSVRRDPPRLVTGGDHGTRRARGRGQRVRERAHAADRHVPGSRTAADHVVEEAPVLTEGGVVGVREGADERVGEDDPAHEVVGEPRFDGRADRLLEQDPPRLLVVDTPAQVVAGGQGLGERREHPFGDAARHRVEPLPRLVLAARARQPRERLAGAALSAADEQAGGVTVAFDGGVRRDRAAADAEVEVQVPHDLPGQQADQVGVPRQPGVDPGEGPGGHGGSAGVVQPFQHQHGTPGAGQVGGGDQAVVAAADDHRVVRVVRPGSGRTSGAVGVCGGGRHGSW